MKTYLFELCAVFRMESLYGGRFFAGGVTAFSFPVDRT